MIRYGKILFGISILPLLTGCYSEFDLHGTNPKEYYAAHPIENKVEIKHALYEFAFSASSAEVDSESLEKLRELKNISPNAVEEVSLRHSSALSNKVKRIQKVRNILGKYRPSREIIDDTVADDMVIANISYVSVVSPDCPDWKMSSVTTYSNVPIANHGCAAKVNLGLMVDNPRDLVRGQSRDNYDTERSAKALSDYRLGIATNGSDLVTSASSK